MGIPYDPELIKLGSGADQLYDAMTKLEKYHDAIKADESAIIQGLKAYIASWTPGPLKKEIRTYEDAVKAMAEVMGQIVNVTGQKYTDEDVKRYLSYIPHVRLGRGDAKERFAFAKRQIMTPYFDALDYRRERKLPRQELYEKERLGKSAPKSEIDLQLERLNLTP